MPGKSISIWIHQLIYEKLNDITNETGLNRSVIINALLYKALKDLGVAPGDLDNEFKGALKTIEYYVRGK